MRNRTIRRVERGWLCAAVLAAAVQWTALAAESVTLTFRAGNGKPESAFEDVNVVQSKKPDAIERFWTRRQPTAAVDRRWDGTSDAYYLIRLPALLGIKSGQVPADPKLVVKGLLRLVRIPTAGYFPEGWQPTEKQKVAFTVHRLTDPDGFGPWRMPPEAECPPRSRIPFIGVCGAFRDGRSSFHDPRKSLLIPAGRPWRKEAAAGLDAGVLAEDSTLPYSPTSLVYEFDVTKSLKAWAAGEVNDGWAIQVSKDTNVSGRFDFLFHTSLAEKEENRPMLTVVVQPRPFEARWRAQAHVKHPFYLTRDDVARAKGHIEKHEWAKEAAQSILRAGGQWAKMSDAEIGALIPSHEDTRHNISRDVWNHGELLAAASRAYALTGDKRYARPVALALVRLAQAWRHWPIVGEDGTAATAGPGPGKAGPPYAPAAYRGASKWADQLLLMYGGMAYDLTYDSGAFEEISQEERFDAKGLVEQELFREGAQFLLDHQIGYGNFDGYLIGALIFSSLNSGDPDLVHRSVEVFDLLLTNSFSRDGMWFEACGYHGQTCSFYRAPEALRGYSDPPGYTPPKGRSRFEKLDPYAMWPQLRTIYRAPLALVYPDRDCLYVGDTSTGEFWEPHLYRIVAARYGDKDLAQVAGNDLFLGPGDTKPPAGILPEVTRSRLLPAAGFATLRAGEGLTGQTAAILSYGDFGSSHDHTDGLNLGLFGKGRELAADLGYTHTYLRYSWSATTASHNTVLIDAKLQEPGRGDLVYYCADEGVAPSVQVAEATMPRAYPPAKLYSRCVSLITPSDGNSYIVDFFRVDGGRQHDFMLHGPATHKQKKLAVQEGGLKPQRGTLAGENVAYAGGRKGTGSQYTKKDWYSYVTEVRRGKVADKAHCRWEYDDGSGVGLRGTFLPGPGAELFTGTAPSLRLDDGKKSNYHDAKAIDRNRMPVICIRRVSSAGQPLRSTFVSVLEPYRGQPPIRDVKRLDLGHGIVGIKVLANGSTQYVFNGSDGRGGELGTGGADGVRFSGQFGAVSQRGDDVEMLCLVGGGELSGPGWQVKHSGNIVAKVAALRGDLTDEKDSAIVLAPGAPALPDAFQGQVVVLRHRDGTHSAHTIAEVTPEGGKTALKLADQRAFLLSRFVVDRAEGNTLHTPHALRQAGDGWFVGKWLTCDGKTYRITSVRSDGRENIYCRGFLVDVEPEGGQMQIKPGDTCIVHAARPGDELILTHRTFVRKQAPGRYLVRATATKLTLALPAPAGQRNVRYHDSTGSVRTAVGREVQTAQGIRALQVALDPARLKAGQTILELVD
ncbi:MAG TPA: heparinase II/III family protein [Planctomycetota bacterium]|nr:heparinase II/III family protein [Planctomycetota bacterium]